MKNIKSIIKRYLEKETQYAVQLVGPWGRGKTHFYRNTLEKYIESLPTFTDNNRKYKAVYISLFGLASVEQIQIKIFHELLYSRISARTKVSKNTLKISSQLTKLLLSGFLTFEGIKNSKEFTAEITDVAKESVNTGDLFICFDDLERKSSKLLIEDLIGYINVLTEENIKVLIISNDDKIEEPGYKDFKEKVVGISIPYNPEPEYVVDQIITTRYQGFTVYFAFLQKIKAILVDLVIRNDHNYRLLIFALDNLHEVFSSIKKDYLDSNKKAAQKCEEHLPDIAKNVMSISIEYKSSFLANTDRESMLALNSSLFSLLEDYRINNGAKAEEPKDKGEIFVAKYYENKNDYKFYGSIFDFATGACEFDIEQFQEDFKSNYHLDKGDVLPEYQVVNALSYFQVLDLSDIEYREKTLQLIDFAKQGKFKLIEYLMVYHYASRFENILELDLDKLRDELLVTIENLEKDENYIRKDDTPLIQLQHSNSENANQEIIRHKLIEIVKRKQGTTKDQELKNITKTFEKDLANLDERFHNDADFKMSITQTPVFASVNVDLLFEQILTAPPSSILMLKSILNERYGYSIPLESERNFLSILTEKLDYHLEDNPENTLRIWTINELLKHLFGITSQPSKEYEILNDEELE
jgi:hypothetical protein